MLLNFIRRHTKVIFTIILCLIIVPFLFWGVGSIVREDEEGKEGSGINIGSHKISRNTFRRALRDSQIQFIINFVETNKIASADQLAAYGQWLNQLMNQVNMQQLALQLIVMQKETRNYGFQTTRKEIKAWLENFPLFQIEGQFDFTTYETLVKNLFSTWPVQFEATLTRLLNIKKLEKLIAATVLVSDDEALQAYKERNEKAVVYYLRIESNDYLTQVGEISPEELQAYYNKHKEEFREPEKIKITYLVFDPAAKKDEIEIGPKEIEEYYSANQEDFKDKEGNTKKLADVKEEIINTLKEQQTEELVYDEALTASIALTERRRGDMIKLSGQNNWPLKESKPLAQTEFIPELGWAPQLMDRVWKMDEDTISEPFRVGNKWVIASPQEKIASQIPELTRVEDKVRHKLKTEKADELAEQQTEELAAKIKERMKNNTPFTIAAKSLGLKVSKTKPFTINGPVPKLGAAEEFAQIAFKTKPGTLAGPVKISGGYALISLRRTHRIDPEEWKKEKKQFSETYLTQKKRRFLNQWQTQLLQQSAGK